MPRTRNRSRNRSRTTSKRAQRHFRGFFKKTPKEIIVTIIETDLNFQDIILPDYQNKLTEELLLFLQSNQSTLEQKQTKQFNSTTIKTYNVVLPETERLVREFMGRKRIKVNVMKTQYSGE